MKVTTSTEKENISALLSATLRESKPTVRMKSLMRYCSQTERQSISIWVRIFLYFLFGTF